MKIKMEELIKQLMDETGVMNDSIALVFMKSLSEHMIFNGGITKKLVTVIKDCIKELRDTEVEINEKD